MRNQLKLVVIGICLISWGAYAQVNPPWLDNVVYELQQVPIDPDALYTAEVDLHFSLRDGETYDLDGHTLEEQVLLAALVAEIGKPQSELDRKIVAARFTDLANIVELDTDGDGWVDSEDAYPDDPDCWIFTIPGDHWPAGQNC